MHVAVWRNDYAQTMELSLLSIAQLALLTSVLLGFVLDRFLRKLNLTAGVSSKLGAVTL